MTARRRTIVRVGSGTNRRVVMGAEPVRFLIVGGVPGSACSPAAQPQLGAPDPAASY